MIDKASTISALLDDLSRGEKLLLMVEPDRCLGLPPNLAQGAQYIHLQIVIEVNEYEELPSGIRAHLGFRGVWTWVTIPWEALLAAGVEGCQVTWAPSARKAPVTSACPLVKDTPSKKQPPMRATPAKKKTSVPYLRLIQGGGGSGSVA